MPTCTASAIFTTMSTITLMGTATTTPASTSTRPPAATSTLMSTNMAMGTTGPMAAAAITLTARDMAACSRIS